MALCLRNKEELSCDSFSGDPGYLQGADCF